MDNTHGAIDVRMRARDKGLRRSLAAGLVRHERRRDLPGLAHAAARVCLIDQIIESMRRVQYPLAIRKLGIWSGRADPKNDGFDPLKAAALHLDRGDVEEAYWLVFLFILFGRNAKSGYRLLRDVYAGSGAGGRWTWRRTSARPRMFYKWLTARIKHWKNDGVHRGFGAHRGHERLESITTIVKTYVAWIAPPRTHVEVVGEAIARSEDDPGVAFDILYKSMRVYRFGRLARFDYLAMIGKLGMARIEPRSTYVLEGTGPLSGARLLYGGNKADKSHDGELDQWLVEFGKDLGIGQQVVEDALCNWQKNPTRFRRFRG